jgi:phospholipase C
LQATVSGLVPNRYYLLMATYRPVGERVVELSLKDAQAERYSWSRCNSKTEQASRHDFYDGSMNLNADGSFTCWGIVKFTQNSAVLRIELVPQNAGSPY